MTFTITTHQLPETMTEEPIRIIEALPGSMVIFPDQVTEDTWHLFIETAWGHAWCPTCGGKGCNGYTKLCSACQGKGIKE